MTNSIFSLYNPLTSIHFLKRRIKSSSSFSKKHGVQPSRNTTQPRISQRLYLQAFVSSMISSNKVDARFYELFGIMNKL